MSEPSAPVIELGPEWVVAEMPPGYQNRLREIQMLMADLEVMGRFSRLLTATGGRLADVVQAVFAALPLDTAAVDGDRATVAVTLPGHGRLLVHVSEEAAVVQKKGEEIAHVFHLLHEVADDRDRVVLLTNTEPTTPPAGRGQAVTAEAAAFLARLGVSHVTAPTLFSLWKLSLQEPERAREQVLRLHAHDGGSFELPAYARV